MAGYSVGDRVEVRWEKVLRPAEVVRVLSLGKLDVVLENDDAVVTVTAAEHGLRLLPAETNLGGGGGKHGAYGECIRPDCTSALYTGRSTRAAPKGLLNEGRSTGRGSQIFLILTCAQY